MKSKFIKLMFLLLISVYVMPTSNVSYIAKTAEEYQQVKSIEFKYKAKEELLLQSLAIGIPIALLAIAHYFSPITSSQFEILKPGTIKESFKSVAGASQAKEALADIVDYLKNPQDFAKLGAKIPKGILLTGNPGTGKTLLARALAGEVNCSFISITGSEFEDGYVGTGPARLRKLFALAKQHAPCVIFIDEIDTLAGKRYQGSHATPYVNETINQFLACMDGFKQNDKPIIVIGATNLAANLDEAVLRPGRFDRIIEVPLPNQQERFEILQIHAKNIATNPEQPDQLDEQLKKIAQRTPGLSGAQLQALINEATWLATKNKETYVTNACLEQAVDNITLGRPNTQVKLLALEKRVTAYHEAGHALLGLLTKHQSNSLYGVSILPRAQALGITYSTRPEHKHGYNKEEFLDHIAIKLAGRAAEELMFQEIGTGTYSDFKAATNLAYDMVCTYGMTDNLGNRVYFDSKHLSESMRAKIDQEINNILQERYKFVMQTLKRNKDLLIKLAEELIKQETLYADQICELLNIRPANESQLKAAMIV